MTEVKSVTRLCMCMSAWCVRACLCAGVEGCVCVRACLCTGVEGCVCTGAEASLQVRMHVEVRGQCQILSSILHPSRCHHHHCCRHRCPPPPVPPPPSDAGVFIELTDWSGWLNAPASHSSLPLPTRVGVPP